MSKQYKLLGLDNEFHREAYALFMNQFDPASPHWMVRRGLNGGWRILIDKGDFRYELSYDIGAVHVSAAFTVYRPHKETGSEGKMMRLIIRESSDDPIYDEICQAIAIVRKYKDFRDNNAEQLKEKQLRDYIRNNLK